MRGRDRTSAPCSSARAVPTGSAATAVLPTPLCRVMPAACLRRNGEPARRRHRAQETPAAHHSPAGPAGKAIRGCAATARAPRRSRRASHADRPPIAPLSSNRTRADRSTTGARRRNVRGRPAVRASGGTPLPCRTAPRRCSHRGRAPRRRRRAPSPAAWRRSGEDPRRVPGDRSPGASARARVRRAAP